MLPLFIEQHKIETDKNIQCMPFANIPEFIPIFSKPTRASMAEIDNTKPRQKPEKRQNIRRLTAIGKR